MKEVTATGVLQVIVDKLQHILEVDTQQSASAFLKNRLIFKSIFESTVQK